MIKAISLSFYKEISRSFELTKGRKPNSTENHFTVLIGENGTYKSEVLKAIVQTVRPGSRNAITILDSIELYNTNLAQQLTYIAVSTSPFDKFPLTKSEMTRKS